MIENIYSNVAGRDGEYPVSGRKPPKNVRQIGTFRGDFRIYVEDYVHTFTRWLAEQDHTERTLAVLVGEFASSGHTREVYAYGTVIAKQACTGGKIEMGAQVWTQVYENIKQYFPDGEIVGWFCGGTSFTPEEKEEIWQVHLDHFAGVDRILMLYDFLDREEEFYRYEEGGMARQDGYYIYYEKNTEMQNYMIDQKQGRSSEEAVNDRAVQKMRAKWNSEKKEEESEETKESTAAAAPQGGGNRFLYMVGVSMTAVALIAAASMLYNQERLKGFEQTLNKLLGNVEGEEENDSQEVSGKVQDGDDVQDNQGAMNWDFTGKNQDENGDRKDVYRSEGTKSNDPPSDMEAAPTIVDVMPTKTGEEDRDDKGDGKNEGSQPDDNDGVGGKTEEDDSNLDEEDGKDGNQNTIKDDAENPDNASLPKDDSKEEADAGDETDGDAPEPGDAVQTGGIGGSGPAVDTSNMRIYTVEAGDTLVGICRKFYGNLEQLEYIKNLNQINDENLIYIDQELVLP